MDRALVAILGAVGAAVVVLAVGAIWLTADRGRSDVDLVPEPTVIAGVSFPAIDHDPAAADDLVAAWERWRTATFVSIGTWTRTLDDRPDEPLTGDVYVAQDPPRRLVTRLGAVVERQGDEVSACSPTEEDVISPACLAGAGIGYEELVIRELGLVRQYVSGDTRIYDIDRSDGGCFRAELIGAALSSPWGRWAEYCFDADTGALQSARVRRVSAIDTESAIQIRPDVTDEDFGGG